MESDVDRRGMVAQIVVESKQRTPGETVRAPAMRASPGARRHGCAFDKPALRDVKAFSRGDVIG
jgi:hypothetical protein